MERVGRIIEWRGGTATIEVGLQQECVSGSCSDCHASVDGRWVFKVSWSQPWAIGQRVLVKERRGVFKLLQWVAFLVAFCAVLAVAQQVEGAARSEGTVAQRVAIVAGLVVATVASLLVRAWSRRQPPFRVVPLDAASPDRPHMMSSPEHTSRHERSPRPVRQFVSVENVQRIER